MGNQQVVRDFTEKEAKILVKASGKSEDEVRRWYDEFQQETGRVNRMNKRQFHNYYSKLMRKENLDEITDHIFRAFDTDHSGNQTMTISVSDRRVSFRYDRFPRVSSRLRRHERRFNASEIRLRVRSVRYQRRSAD